MYCVLGCVVCPEGGGGVDVEGKGKYGSVDTTRLKNLGGIKSEGGLLSLFDFVGGSAVWKFQHHRFPLWRVIFVLS